MANSYTWKSVKPLVVVALTLCLLNSCTSTPKYYKEDYSAAYERDCPHALRFFRYVTALDRTTETERQTLSALFAKVQASGQLQSYRAYVYPFDEVYGAPLQLEKRQPSDGIDFKTRDNWSAQKAQVTSECDNLLKAAKTAPSYAYVKPETPSRSASDWLFIVGSALSGAAAGYNNSGVSASPQYRNPQPLDSQTMAPRSRTGVILGPRPNDIWIDNGSMLFGPNGQTWIRSGNMTFGPKGQTIIDLRQ